MIWDMWTFRFVTAKMKLLIFDYVQYHLGTPLAPTCFPSEIVIDFDLGSYALVSQSTRIVPGQPCYAPENSTDSTVAWLQMAKQSIVDSSRATIFLAISESITNTHDCVLPSVFTRVFNQTIRYVRLFAIKPQDTPGYIFVDSNDKRNW